MMQYGTQNDMVQEHLNTFKGITDRQAYELYGCKRLAARISDLRHERGLKITTERHREKNRFGKPVTVVVYRLEEN